jgi:hypothetical protein
VNALAMTYVNIYLENLSIGTKRNGAVVSKPSLRDRIASAAAGIGRMLGPDSGPVVPELKNYPYGG